MTFKIRYLSLLALLCACSSAGDGDIVDGAPPSDDVGNPLDRGPDTRDSLTAPGAFATLRDGLRPRLNLKHVRMPAAGSAELRGISGELSVDRFLNTLAGSERVAVGPVELRSGSLATRLGTKLIEIDRTKGSVLIDDERGYETDTSALLEDEDLTSRSRDILASLGVAEAEHAMLVRTLVAEEKPLNLPPNEKAALAYKVIVKRIVGGLSVRGERLVLSYALDGSLRKVSGRWRALDLGASRLRIDTSLTDIGERALARVEKAALDNDLGLAAEGELRVLTNFTSETASGGRYSLKPVGRVFVPINGPGGTMFSEFEFDL